MKAIILVQASSGLSAQNIEKLKVKDFEKGIIEQYDRVHKKKWYICKLNFERGRYGDQHVTFLSDEAIEAVKNYLKHERDNPKPNQALFSDARDSGKPFTVKGIQEAYRRLNNSLKWKPENKGQFRRATSKSITEFFKVQMINSGLNTDFIRYMMGLKVNVHVDEEKLMEKYIENVHNVTLKPVKPPISMDTYNELMDLMHDYADMVENEEFNHDNELMEENRNLREALDGVMSDNDLFKRQFEEMNKKIEELQKEIKKSE